MTSEEFYNSLTDLRILIIVAGSMSTDEVENVLYHTCHNGRSVKGTPDERQVKCQGCY
jgi:hypothetical protein